MTDTNTETGIMMDSDINENTGIIGAIMGGLAQSTRTIQDINRANMAAVRADTKANYETATAPNPGMVKFMGAKGLGNKVKAIVENLKAGIAEASEVEQIRRAEIQSHESYRTLLEEQRESRQAVLTNPYYPYKIQRPQTL